MTEFVVDLLGWIGALALLLPYYFVSIGRIDGKSKSFQLSNLVGSFLLIINSLYYGALPSVVVNLVWIAIGSTMLFKMAKQEKKA
ncbi:MAG: hypothetical protein KUG78_03505 [Kangiellaceae bacterium]|nr:hypothetical protein [Kangiellaceae bacterium]